MRTRTVQKVKRAFTLIEILIVVVILGILAAIIIPQFAESADSAKESAAKSMLQTVRAQVELYRFKEDGSCPALDDLCTDNYLHCDGATFEQPEGYTISIDATTCAVSMAQNP